MPPFWVPQREKVAVFPVFEGCEEWVAVANRFYDSVDRSVFSLVSLERVQVCVRGRVLWLVLHMASDWWKEL